MPIKTRGQASNVHGLTHEEAKHLTLALTELRSRGLNIDLSSIEGNGKNIDKWNVDPDGYFFNNEMRRFIPNSDHQRQFIESNAQFVALISGRGAGKTSSGAQKVMRKIRQGESGVAMNPDMENFKYSTWTELQRWIDWGMVLPNRRYMGDSGWMPRQPFTIPFMNNAVLYCKGLKDPESARGANVNFLWYDEAGRDDTGLGWQIAIGSVRVGENPQRFITTTPKGTLHWIYRFFVKKEIPKEALDIMNADSRELIEVFYNTIDDNKGNLAPDFYASMLAAYPSGWLREQELYGKFVDEGTSLGNRSWFIGKILMIMPVLDEIKNKVRYWDLAATEKKMIGKKSDDPDFTCGTRLSQKTDGSFVIEHQVAAQISWLDIKRLIVETAMGDGKEIPIYIEQEPGAGGKNQVAEISMISELSGFVVKGHRPEGDKIMRANVWFSRAEQGLVFLVRGGWNEPFLDELSNFPSRNIKDDRIDSVSGAFSVLAPMKKWSEIQYLAV